MLESRLTYPQTLCHAFVYGRKLFEEYFDCFSGNEIQCGFDGQDCTRTIGDPRHRDDNDQKHGG